MATRVVVPNSLALFAAICSILPGNAFSAPLFPANELPLIEASSGMPKLNPLAQKRTPHFYALTHTLPQAIPGSRYAGSSLYTQFHWLGQ
jgi:hypothetical protein